MRRVRCDLKDLPGSNQTGAACSNCRERGLKCVDEFAEVKAVKLLRRGRRLQQAEAVYGKVPPELDSLRSNTPPPSVIPRLALEFFDSAFFARFQVQRPILEPLEFKERYFQYIHGNNEALTAAAHLIAMTLVVWAATFGLNEAGVEDNQHDVGDIRSRKEYINDMLQELLYLVDLRGVLRKASWDGVRLLLLLLPLTQEIQKPIDRLVMYEATLSQVYNLCSLAPMSTVDSGQGEYVDALVCARLFWYAHITDGVTSGLRGGRILLSDYDLTVFEARLPPHQAGSLASETYSFTFHCMSIPVRISSICRTIHAVLTGPLARPSDHVKEELLEKVWVGLDKCWTDLDSLRGADAGEILDSEDLDRFVNGWQIFIFECENVIRESLQKKLVSSPTPSARTMDTVADAPSNALGHLAVMHEQAKARCHAVARKVVAVIKQNLGTAFFQYDASLVRDGCFFAAFLLAKESGTSDEVEACLQAMQEMRWVFSKSEERIHTVRMVWESRMQQMQASIGTSGAMTEPVGSVAAAGDELSFNRRPLGRSMTIPPLTIPSGVSSGSSSAPSTSATGEQSWPSTTSSSRPHSGSASLYATSPIESRTSSYSSLPQLASSMLHVSNSKDPMLASPSLVLGSHMPQELSFDRTDDAYYQSYRYLPPPGEGSSQMALVQQPAAPVLLMPSYHQMQPYPDSVMHFETASLGHSTEHHMLSADDGEDELVHRPSLY
ncbi:hypothetical protein BC835DRAFT_1445328 [Cytidiella melzeri]|nr:hypothetical protein BC835DRAFT_1445328 [Cytidiella melzeri]